MAVRNRRRGEREVSARSTSEIEDANQCAKREQDAKEGEALATTPCQRGKAAPRSLVLCTRIPPLEPPPTRSTLICHHRR